MAALLIVAVFALGAFVACDNKQTENDIFAITSGDVTVELGKKADGVLEKLGEPVSQQNTGNCGGLGETVRYDYSSLVLVVVDYEDGDKIIDQIVLKNDGAETTKGIYIGSSEADVKAKYGDADETVGSALVYTKGEKRLEIGITDGMVSSIVLKCD